MEKYNVIFIGTGHACWHGALTLTLAGKKVAMAECGVLGGTCTNFGCDAKILLDSPFEYLDGLANYQGLCVEDLPQIDWTKLMAYKKEQIGMLPLGLGGLFQNLNMPVLQGKARILDAHTVQVGETCYEAEQIVIGTGARDFIPEIPGKELLHTSRDFLDLDVMPDSLVFIGAGIISMEFASIALKLGKKVTIVEFADRALAAYPKAYVDKLVAKMEQEGAVFHFNEKVTGVEAAGAQVTVKTESGLAVTADYALSAIGRVANVEDLGLEELGIEASRRGIKVNECLQTSVENIYVSGDAIDKTIPKLTPPAAFESDYIAAHILGLTPGPIVYPAVPNLVFTLPRIAQVGVTVEEAAAAPEKYRTVSIPYGQMMLWNARNEKDIDITFIFDREQRLLAGAAIYGSDAGAWIDVLTLIINNKMNALQLGQQIFAFPTSTYGLISTLLPQFNAE